MSYQPDSKQRLERWHLAMSTLPSKEADTCAHIMLGALSSYVTEQEWASCVETALLLVKQMAASA